MKKQVKSLFVLGALSLLITSCTINLPSSSSEPEKYTVTWKNSDGTVLETDNELLEGVEPSYDGSTPVKDSDSQYNYVFAGWTPEVKPVSGNVEYTATYREELRKYTVIWKNYNDNFLETDEDVPYGTLPEFNALAPTKESTVESTFTFDGWTPEVKEVEGDVVYTAKFKEEARKYKITWKNDDGSIIKTTDVPYGTIPEFDGNVTKESTEQYSYTFSGWSPRLSEVTGDAEYSASFQQETRRYTVTWKNYDGSIIRTDENVLYGTTPSFNDEDPVRPDGRGVTYFFKGWSPEIKEVHGDQTYTAEYTNEATFVFERMPYPNEEDGLEGAPWVNVNIEGQIDKIGKPSLKDDFYTAINYDDIKNGNPGPFDVSSKLVRDAISSVFDGTSQTTNGTVISKMYQRMQNGDVNAVSNHLSVLTNNNYFSSRECFSSPSSFLQISLTGENSYEVVLNDGYVDGNFGLHTLWYWSDYYGASLSSAASCLSNTFGLSLEDTDLAHIRDLEKDILNTLYYNTYYVGSSENTYSVDTVPWTFMKSALLGLGLENNATIKIKKYVVNSINSFVEKYYDGQPSVLNNAIKLRSAFDYRFTMGINNYRTLNSYLTDLGAFEDESGLFEHDDNSLTKELVYASVPLLIEQSYLELEGNDEIKAKVAELINSILEGYEEVVEDADWLGERSKLKTLTKLEKMKYESCYPNEYKNFVALDQSNIQNDTLFDLYNIYYNGLIDTALIGQINKSFIWSFMSTYTVNAFYYAGTNSFVILNGLVKGFVSDKTEVLYGALGFVIGHEITHGFDSSGSQYDENGNNNNIWTNTDRNKFNQKVNKLIDFYNNITLYGDTTVNGGRVDGEATADMGGIRVMLKLAEKIPDFDYDLFFKSCARTWIQTPYSLDYLEERTQDEHPYEYLRANVTLAQFEKFYEVYDIQPGDGMYIPEDERIAIW